MGDVPPQDVFGNLNLTNVTDVYALLNAYHPGGKTAATFEFIGTDGSGAPLEQDVPLVEGTDIRDFYKGQFNDNINGTTTQNAFLIDNVQGAAGTGNTMTGLTGTYHSDEVDFHFATPFATLQHIYLVSNSGDNVVLLGATAQTTVCFVTGTRIATLRGDVPVEALQAGDMAVTASGTVRPIVWVGHRDMTFAHGAAASAAWPVRVSAGAFGSDLPERDLWLSPGHPVVVGSGPNEVLVPIMCLVNGTTIDRVPVDRVTYWHIELDCHDILLAEGLPAESYLDWGDRAFFSDAEAHALANPDFVVPGLAGRCRPVAVDGPVVEAERRRLDAVFAGRLSKAAAWPDIQNALLALV